MTQSAINEGNALIAEFLGWKKEGPPKHEYYQAQTGDFFEYTHYRPSEMKFHKDCNWMRLVWENFRDLKYTEETPMKLHLNYVARLSQDFAYGTLEEFFHNICIAIKWHNTLLIK